MKWQHKAAIFRILARLPKLLGSWIHYLAQSRLGRLRSLEPWTRFGGGAKAGRFMIEQNRAIVGMRVLEVGTGWRVNAPLAFSLMGAAEVLSVDLNRFLRPELIKPDIETLCQNQDRVMELLGPDVLVPERWQALKRLSLKNQLTIEDLQKQLGIKYIAPADATCLTDLASDTFDLHYSENTLEHIPPDVLKGILSEAYRVLNSDGLLIHGIDQSDHFAQTDKSIPSAYFLRFEDQEWDKIAGNRFSYVNRLRAPDYRNLFEHAGFCVLDEERTVDPQAEELIRSGQLILASPFQKFTPAEAACRFSWLVAKIS